MKRLALSILFSCFPTLSAQENDPPKLPAQIWFAETLKQEPTWDELKQLLPGLGPLEKYIPSAPHLGRATDQITLLDTPFTMDYSFTDGRLSGWGANASKLDHAKAIAVADFLLTTFQGRYGPAVREVYLPSESDGPRDEVGTNYLWNINGQEFAMSLNLRPGSASVGFSAYRTIMVSGNYFIADPQNPTRGLLGAREAANPEPFEIISDPGSRDKFHVLQKLRERGVTGTRPQRTRELADYGQTLDLFGGKSTREKDGQRCFRLEWFHVKFPVTIWRHANDGSRYAEVHFNMHSLFPNGIEFEGKAIDLKPFEDWSSDVPKPKEKR